MAPGDGGLSLTESLLWKNIAYAHIVFDNEGDQVASLSIIFQSQFLNIFILMNVQKRLPDIDESC